MEYNGWKNYETWCVNLWLDNDEGTQNMCVEWAEETYRAAKATQYSTRSEVAARELANQIKEFVEDNNPVARDNSVYSDLMSAAISEVDFEEIAEHFLGDCGEVQEAEKEGK